MTAKDYIEQETERRNALLTIILRQTPWIMLSTEKLEAIAAVLRIGDPPR